MHKQMCRCAPVLILDGNSEKGAHARSNICHLICLRHSIRSSAVTKSFFFKSENNFFLYALCSELPSNISTMRYVGPFNANVI